jgi:hypothetical protein
VDGSPYYPIERLLNILFDLSDSLVYELGGIAVSFGGPSEVLPEYCLCNLALCYSARAIVYLLLRVLIYIVIRILPNILGLVVNSGIEIVLVVGVICRYLNYPSPSFDSSDLLT